MTTGNRKGFFCTASNQSQTHSEWPDRGRNIYYIKSSTDYRVAYTITLLYIYNKKTKTSITLKNNRNQACWDRHRHGRINLFCAVSLPPLRHCNSPHVMSSSHPSLLVPLDAPPSISGYSNTIIIAVCIAVQSVSVDKVIYALLLFIIDHRPSVARLSLTCLDQSRRLSSSPQCTPHRLVSMITG